MPDLTTPDGLKAACDDLEKSTRRSDSNKEWTEDLRKFLPWIRQADEPVRATLEFQQHLWDENPVSGVGQGNISVAALIADQEFRLWLAHQSLVPLPNDPLQRLNALNALYDEIVHRCKDKTTRVPHLKIFRVLAGFFPQDFTCLAHRVKLNSLCHLLHVEGVGHVSQHIALIARIRELVGTKTDSLDDTIWLMQLPWYLWLLAYPRAEDPDEPERPGVRPGEEVLLPLPATRRRRGLTAIKGGLSTVLGILEFVRESPTREELMDHLRSVIPGLKDSSLRMVINILRSELGVVRQAGDIYQLSDRGSAVLESGEASELGNWLITRILGVDHVLVMLLKGGLPESEIVQLLQKANPGWTSAYAPTSLLNWLRSFGAVEKTPERKVQLLPLGKEWASRIVWEPEFLTFEDEPEISVPAVANELVLPALNAIHDRIDRHITFDPQTITRLHLGLWSPRIRHFAVLTGLSGSGKTQLAIQYGAALTPHVEGDASRVHVEAVQPGWYDPGVLLGYVNPLRGDTYTRTKCLEFVLRAADDPSQPYVLVLDEMNLSHPEQYFAPFLSAMETGGKINLHAEGDVFDGVRGSINYPRNLAIIGTINMDETTHGLSDKVLDRAFVLEFWDIDLSAYPRWNDRNLPVEVEEQIRELLSELLRVLSPARLHFGWRVVDDILDFMQLTVSSGVEKPLDHLDSIIYAKVLPKLRGDDNPRFRTALAEVKKVAETRRLKKCTIRIDELINDVKTSGSARFWR